MAFSVSQDDTYIAIQNMLCVNERRIQNKIREMEQMCQGYNQTSVATSQEDKKKEKLNSLIAHYYHLRK